MSANRRRRKGPRQSAADKSSPARTSVVSIAPGRRLGPWKLLGLTGVMVGLAVVGGRWSLLERTRAVVQRELASRRFEEAEAGLGRMQAFGAGGGEVALTRARLARLRGETAASRDWLDRAAQAGAPPAALQRERLLLETQQDIGSVSLERLTQALQAEPDDAESVYEASVIGCTAAGDFDAALSVLSRWETAFPDSALPAFRRGELLLILEQFAAAEETFREALGRDPKLVDARLGLLQALDAQSKRNEALREARLVVRADPENLEARRIRVQLLRDAGEATELLRDIETILEAHPDDYEARYELAGYHARHDQPEKVIETLRPIRDAYPFDVSLNYLLAQAHERLGQVEQADEALERYFQGRVELNRLIKIEQGLDAGLATPETAKHLALGFLKVRWQKAELWIAEALAGAPRDPEVLRAAAEWFARRHERVRSRRYREAAGQLEAASS